jgi:hypothetical protein
VEIYEMTNGSEIVFLGVFSDGNNAFTDAVTDDYEIGGKGGVLGIMPETGEGREHLEGLRCGRLWADDKVINVYAG